MHRRDFLKVAGLGAAALVVLQLSPASAGMRPPVEATVGGRQWRGTNDGKVSVSDDGGATWRPHTDFGPDLAVRSFEPAPAGLVRVTLAAQGHPFALDLDVDDSTWRTA